MQNFVDVQSVQRKGQIGRWTMYLGLALSIGAVILVFRDPAYFIPTLVAVIIGSIMSQVGAVYYGRFGRSPRLDEVLASGLKGLDDNFVIYQYYLKADHLIFTPAGAVALFPRLEEGEIVWEDETWVLKSQKRFPIPRISKKKMRRLHKEVDSGVVKVKQQLDRLLPEAEVDVHPLVVFIHPGTQIENNGETVPATHLKKLKSTLRNLPRSKSLDRDSIEQLTKMVGAKELQE